MEGKVITLYRSNKTVQFYLTKKLKKRGEEKPQLQLSMSGETVTHGRPYQELEQAGQHPLSKKYLFRVLEGLPKMSTPRSKFGSC